MTRSEYNGWTNYETWLVKLWLDNDEHDYWVDQAHYVQGDVAKLANLLKQEHDDALPDGLSGFALDLVRAGLGEVNWDEIAQSLIKSADEVYDTQYAKAEGDA